jgi:hypothetical protein
MLSDKNNWRPVIRREAIKAFIDANNKLMNSNDNETSIQTN